MATKKKTRRKVKSKSGKKSKSVASKPARSSAKKKKGTKARTGPVRSRRSKKTKRLGKVELLERQVRSLQKRLSKYEHQRFQGPLLPGQKRRKPPRTELDAVRSKLKLFLEGLKEALEVQDVAAHYRSHENSDHSIDAEVRVMLEDSGDLHGVLIDIEDAGPWNGLRDFWLMLGVMLKEGQVTGSPTIDRRPNRAWTNPVRGSRAGAMFFTARETVRTRLEEWGAEIGGVIIRIFWHPDNLRPHRPRK